MITRLVAEFSDRAEPYGLGSLGNREVAACQIGEAWIRHQVADFGGIETFAPIGPDVQTTLATWDRV
jgi:hypothetical protein